MDWLGRYMRDFIGGSNAANSPKNILIQDRAFETEIRANTLVERAIEKLRLGVR